MVRSSLARLPEDALAVAWNICRRLHSVSSGITGYAFPSADAELALLQHYFGVSPVVDLTGSPDVAMFFALNGAEVGDECVIYALEVAAVRDCRVVEHDFLILPHQDGGLKHRWLRQDGYGLVPNAWPAVDAVRNFDMLKCSSEVAVFRFEKTVGDQAFVWNHRRLLELANDPLPRRIRGVIEKLTEHFEYVMPDVLKESLARVCESSPKQDLLNEIMSLQSAADSLGLTDVSKELDTVTCAVQSGGFDTSWECLLSVLRDRIVKPMSDA